MTDGLGAVPCLVRRLLPDGPCSVRVCLPWGRVVARREQVVSEPGLEPGFSVPETDALSIELWEPIQLTGRDPIRWTPFYGSMQIASKKQFRKKCCF